MRIRQIHDLSQVIRARGPVLLGVGVAVGRVVRFDNTRGYGFITPESGGEDVFLHVNDLLIPEAFVRSGIEVEFEVGNGGRGLKASSVRLAPGAAATVAAPFGPAASAASSAAVALPVPTPVPVPAPMAGSAAAVAEDVEPMCDVLSVREYTQEVTELLLKAVPEMTGAQILQIRHELVEFAGVHGWTEE
jgi:CspA family cold shock protein